RRTPTPTLFPYTTLFRSPRGRCDGLGDRGRCENFRQWQAANKVHDPIAPDESVKLLPRRIEMKKSGMTLLRVVKNNPECHPPPRSEEHTSELQSRENLVC